MAKHLSPIAMFAAAASFAAEKHRNQRRKNAEASPYINHPLALANVLAIEGDIEGATALCAAVLHDTVEDTETTEAELREEFGDEVASVVMEVTDDKTLPKATRKALQIEHAPHLSYPAKLVKLADKIVNLRDILASPPESWSLERKQAYFDWAAQVVDGLRGANSKLEAVFDEVYARRDEMASSLDVDKGSPKMLD